MNKYLSYIMKILVMSSSLLMAFDASADISDPKPPKFSDGQQGKTIYNITGISGDSVGAILQTVFFCTNMHRKANIIIGVEIFTFDGVLQNNITNNQGVVLPVHPGQTVTISTYDTDAFHADKIITLGGIVDGGSARIVSTSPKIICNALLVDPNNAIPTSIMKLPVFKGTQKGD